MSEAEKHYRIKFPEVEELSVIDKEIITLMELSYNIGYEKGYEEGYQEGANDMISKF